MADRLRTAETVVASGLGGMSTATQLQNDPVTCGSGAPTHTPDRKAQTYTDTATGTVYQYWAGSWK